MSAPVEAADRSPASAVEDAPARRRWRPSWPALALAAFTVLLGLVLARYGQRLWIHSLDEDEYRVLGVYTFNDLPGSLWNLEASNRGIQRLAAWILGAPLELFGTPDGFRVARALETVVYCSTVIPVWIWARAAGAGRVYAMGAAALAIAVPWASVTATFLTENVAYPLTVWALLAIWHAALAPRLSTLVLAFVAVVAASAARSVMMLLLGVLVVTMVVVAVRCHGRQAWAVGGRWSWGAAAPWLVMAAVSVVVAGVYLFDRDALHPLVGTYLADVNFKPDLAWLLLKRSVAKVVSGGGILPGIVAVAFVGRALWRPARPASFALAVIAVQMTAFVVYSSMRAGIDERYLMFLAPVVVVCAAVGLSRREVRPIGVLVSAVLVVVLFAVVDWESNQAGFGYFVNAAEAFHARVLVLGIGSRLPDVGVSYDALLAAGILAAAAALAWGLWRGGRAGRVVLGVLGAGVLVLQLAQVVYIDRRFTAEANFAGKTLDERAWVDHAAKGRGPVGFFASRTGADWDIAETWREVVFWNASIDRLLTTPKAPFLNPFEKRTQAVVIDPENGHLTSDGPPLPRLMVEWTLTPVSPLVGRTIARTDYEPQALVEVDPPARLAWEVRGTDAAGWTVADRTASIRVFRDAPGGRCLDIDVLGAPGQTGLRRVSAAGVSVRVHAGEPGTLRGIRLRGGTAGHFADVRLAVDGVTRVGTGQLRGVQLTGIRRVACR